MTLVKVSELEGAALDWAVAKCEGAPETWRNNDGPFLWDGVPCIWRASRAINFEPSTDWAQGGPIIEREGGTLWSTNASGWRYKWPYNHVDDKEGPSMIGPTPLIAAMRCYVASKMGDSIEIPKELV